MLAMLLYSCIPMLEAETEGSLEVSGHLAIVGELQDD